MPGEKDAHPSEATFSLSLHQTGIDEVQLAPPAESSGILACVVKNSALDNPLQHRRENTAIATVPGVSSLPVGVAVDPDTGKRQNEGSERSPLPLSRCARRRCVSMCAILFVRVQMRSSVNESVVLRSGGFCD